MSDLVRGHHLLGITKKHLLALPQSRNRAGWKKGLLAPAPQRRAIITSPEGKPAPPTLSPTENRDRNGKYPEVVRAGHLDQSLRGKVWNL